MIDQMLKKMFENTRTIAVVGLSKDWNRPSNFVAKYLLQHGFKVVPVNPRYEEIFELKSFPTVAEIPFEVDVVNCFRRPEDLDDILQDAIEKSVKGLWLQIGVVNPEVKRAAEKEGIKVVMNRCVKIEHARLFGGLNFVGVNTKVISSKRSRQVYN